MDNTFEYPFPPTTNAPSPHPPGFRFPMVDPTMTSLPPPYNQQRSSDDTTNHIPIKTAPHVTQGVLAGIIAITLTLVTILILFFVCNRRWGWNMKTEQGRRQRGRFKPMMRGSQVFQIGDVEEDVGKKGGDDMFSYMEIKREVQERLQGDDYATSRSDGSMIRSLESLRTLYSPLLNVKHNLASVAPAAETGNMDISVQCVDDGGDGYAAWTQIAGRVMMVMEGPSSECDCDMMPLKDVACSSSPAVVASWRFGERESPGMREGSLKRL
ncbi:hypothetical protein BC829DRAFT_408795 [Chytridium lagenaria]|nr:hypothetical protein BC829DRAFT_408795 [Chytridium lagenaria]